MDNEVRELTFICPVQAYFKMCWLLQESHTKTKQMFVFTAFRSSAFPDRPSLIRSSTTTENKGNIPEGFCVN